MYVKCPCARLWLFGDIIAGKQNCVKRLGALQRNIRCDNLHCNRVGWLHFGLGHCRKSMLLTH